MKNHILVAHESTANSRREFQRILDLLSHEIFRSLARDEKSDLKFRMRAIQCCHTGIVITENNRLRDGFGEIARNRFSRIAGFGNHCLRSRMRRRFAQDGSNKNIRRQIQHHVGAGAVRNPEVIKLGKSVNDELRPGRKIRGERILQQLEKIRGLNNGVADR